MNKLYSRFLIVIALAAAAAPVVILFARLFSSFPDLSRTFRQRQEDRETDTALERVYCEPGPWGNIRYYKFRHNPPPELVDSDAISREFKSGWLFPAKTRDEFSDTIKQLGLSAELVRELLALKPADDSKRVRLVPGPQLVGNMTPGDRARIYGLLARLPENVWQCFPVCFDTSRKENWIAGTGLAPRTAGLLRRLLYEKGPHTLFADLPLMLHQILDPAEKVRFVSAISSCESTIVELCLDRESDLERCADYWSSFSRKEILPLLKGVRRYAEDPSISVSHLLPPPARHNLNLWTDVGPRHDTCRIQSFAAAINFFLNEVSPQKINEGSFIEYVDTRYHPVSERGALGDIMVFIAPSERLLHACVYVAEELVFTRTPGPLPSPWRIMPLHDMEEYFSAHDEVRTRTFRRRTR